MSDLSSVKIFGNGILKSGEFNKVQILGDVDATGDIECNKLSVIGDLRIKGRLKCGDFKVMGECTLEESAEIEKIKILGQVRAEKEVEVKSNLKVVGEFYITNSLKLKEGDIVGQVINKNNIFFDKLKVTGELRSMGDCEGNVFFSGGRLDISGLLSADKIEIVPKGNSIINEIGGSEICIRKNKYWESSSGRVKANLIEGDKITLENTDCDIVRGEEITILGNCNIKRVEYTKTISIDKNSKVGEELCQNS
ncbi:hypothetical protein [Caproiciproducens sp. MSJ-32]|uniref:hypothetical protein n=1 Tax=Caproiciproducens sp. MSJ-32 TaxID=2841527 RepID=UPI001C117D15|nr:hypothetical protein [Caproiciproducens sp. MSJ-32]MBU5455903.1 hypothetical protein [Caproiciproducens sp. MSJ-32]